MIRIILSSPAAVLALTGVRRFPAGNVRGLWGARSHLPSSDVKRDGGSASYFNRTESPAHAKNKKPQQEFEASDWGSRGFLLSMR